MKRPQFPPRKLTRNACFSGIDVGQEAAWNIRCVLYRLLGFTDLAILSREAVIVIGTYALQSAQLTVTVSIQRSCTVILRPEIILGTQKWISV